MSRQFIDEDEDEGAETTSFAGDNQRAPDVPDEGIENAESTPLLVHAKTGKANTVTYLKVTRLDGLADVRGYKGNLPSDATMVTLGRRFGNGTYKIEGCNAKHVVIATESDLEISMPQFADDGPAAPVGVPAPNNGMAGLHSMKLIADHAESHSETVRTMATEQSKQVTDLAKSTVETVQTFATTQRAADRQQHESVMATQQTFFAAMQSATAAATAAAAAAQAASHAQQMEMMTAMHERGRASESNPMQMVEVLVQGMQLARDNAPEGGSPDEPWTVAIREGGAALGHLAQLASSPGAQAATAQLQQARQVRSLPATAPQRPQPPPPARPPVASPAASPAATAPAAAPTDPAAPRRRTRAPFSRDEIRGIAQIRAQLRKRGISLADYIGNSLEHFANAPDSELFEDDGQAGSDNAPSSEHATPKEAPAPDVADEGHSG